VVYRILVNHPKTFLPFNHIPNLMKARAIVNFKGRVQGVFFRANTKDFADSVGVSGWVRNMPDGSVEAVIEGEKEKVLKLIDMCRTKQPHAQVTGADVRWEEFQDEFQRFEVRY
jgi:acylphosphatase